MIWHVGIQVMAKPQVFLHLYHFGTVAVNPCSACKSPRILIILIKLWLHTCSNWARQLGGLPLSWRKDFFSGETSKRSTSCVSWSLCSESEVEDITITGWLAETSLLIDAIVSSLQFSDAHAHFVCQLVCSSQSSPHSSPWSWSRVQVLTKTWYNRCQRSSWYKRH